MKRTISLCAILLGGSMWVAAQQPATSPQTSTPSTPPTFPSDQQKSMPDTAAPASSPAQSSSTPVDTGAAKSFEGCLSQAPSGSGFILTDASGVQYTLQGGDLSSHVGQQIRVTGSLTNTSASSEAANTDNPDSKASAASSDMKSSAASASVITVSKVKKISGTCSASQAPISK